jgi:acyl-CoA synthetase (NDP forming)
MSKLSEDFFINNEVLFVGYSSRNERYSREIYQAFANNGIRVYPLNNKENASYQVKVYKNLSELPAVPKTAYILMNRDKTGRIVKQLAEKGVKRILFHNAKYVDQATLEECKKLGIETTAACPMMLFGGGLHRVHGFFAGVR